MKRSRKPSVVLVIIATKKRRWRIQVIVDSKQFAAEDESFWEAVRSALLATVRSER